MCELLNGSYETQIRNNFIVLEGFARVCTVSSYFPDNPRTLRMRVHAIDIIG